MRIRNFDEEKSILYLVATPIGNMKEMSPRALEILNSVSIIGCEDTRNSGKLLSYFGINKKLISCHEHNEEQASDTSLKYLANKIGLNHTRSISDILDNMEGTYIKRKMAYTNKIIVKNGKPQNIVNKYYEYEIIETFNESMIPVKEIEEDDDIPW